MSYIRGDKAKECVFCADVIDRVGVDLRLLAGRHAFVMMNRYPYTSGHLMIIPHRHLSRMEDLTSAEKAEIFDLIVYSVQALKESIRPDGFNIGMNLGRAAGAGIEDHLHVHVVPRWDGDTNFVSVVGDVRVIPEDVVKTWEQLRPYFKKYQQEA
ncbi:MAG TPA: HIT domain-containing protein [Syntrophales bacterium]|nr:HIT domain-containing protein [Syntrophales bacterium]HON23349.1 HIT domain-containing protein [Syntrophales bacterium]HOU77123.1 HIT domain-containing protein [Syntrophales bacterium]HPC32803.1 HIT domain-containing protein [Syntrophales bacterium]HQG33651.1 HIT domain-containing protein [Syntrophales bacterium]